MDNTEARTMIVGIAALVAVALLAWAVVEMERSTRRIEVIVTKADLAASQVWEVIEEARHITRQAAEGQPE